VQPASAVLTFLTPVFLPIFLYFTLLSSIFLLSLIFPPFSFSVPFSLPHFNFFAKKTSANIFAFLWGGGDGWYFPLYTPLESSIPVPKHFNSNPYPDP
jgi:hypothetical protein